ALLQAVLVPVQQMPADVRSREQRRDLLRILLGDVAPEDLAEGDRETLPHPEEAVHHGPQETRRPGRGLRWAAHDPPSERRSGSPRGAPVNSGHSSASTATVPAPMTSAARPLL